MNSHYSKWHALLCRRSLLIHQWRQQVGELCVCVWRCLPWDLDWTSGLVEARDLLSLVICSKSCIKWFLKVTKHSSRPLWLLTCHVSSLQPQCSSLSWPHSWQVLHFKCSIFRILPVTLWSTSCHTVIRCDIFRVLLVTLWSAHTDFIFLWHQAVSALVLGDC